METMFNQNFGGTNKEFSGAFESGLYSDYRGSFESDELEPSKLY